MIPEVPATTPPPAPLIAALLCYGLTVETAMAMDTAKAEEILLLVEPGVGRDVLVSRRRSPARAARSRALIAGRAGRQAAC